MRRRLFVGLLALTSLITLTPRAAFAKGDFEFVISGNEPRGPVTVSSTEIWTKVHGVAWGPDDTPAALSGRAYVLEFYDRDGFRRHYNGRWLYYPSAGGALILDPPPTLGPGKAVLRTGVPIRWERFSPAFQEVLNAAIRGESHSARNVAVGIAIILAGLLAASIPLFGKRTRFALSYN